MRKDHASILRYFEPCHVISKSSSFPGLLNHKNNMFQVLWKSIVFDHAVEPSHNNIPEQYLHQVNIMLLELDYLNCCIFFRKLSVVRNDIKTLFSGNKYTWNYVKNNVWITVQSLIFTKLICFPHIVRLCNFFTDSVIRCRKRSIVQNCTSTQYQKPWLYMENLAEEKGIFLSCKLKLYSQI